MHSVRKDGQSYKEGMLLGLVQADEELIQQQAKRVAVQMLMLLELHLL